MRAAVIKRAAGEINTDIKILVDRDEIILGCFSIDDQRTRLSEARVAGPIWKTPLDRDGLYNRSVELPINELFAMNKLLGSGSFGAVYLGRTPLTSDALAIKLMNRPPGYEGDQIDHEVRVNRKLAKLGCSRIISMFAAYRVSSTRVAVVMPLARGGSILDKVIASGRFNTTKARIIARDIAMGLSVMHAADIIHRDLAAKNILLDEGRATLCDFGLAWHIPSHDLFGRARPIGTPDYCAPEVFRTSPTSERSYSKAGDIWAFGVVLVNILAGYAPFKTTERSAAYPEGQREMLTNELTQQFESETYGALWASVPDSAKSLILQCLKRNPDERPTAAQILESEWLR
jgi:hypothetical protein